MPPEGEKLQYQQYLDILGSFFVQKGFTAGDKPARLGDAEWRQIIVQTDDQASKRTESKPLEWASYRGNLLSQAYSPARQIDRDNVAHLKIAWRWSARNFGPTPEYRNTTTPLMINGMLYFTAGVTRDVVAVDAVTGETLWIWRPQESQERFDQAPRKGSGRGVAYWRGRHDSDRVFTVTPGFQLVALDARTGRPVPSFGNSGRIDLKVGLRVPPGAPADIGSTSPPLVMGDVVVVGPALLPGLRPKSRANVKGDVRAFDARTGKQLWTFKTVPDSAEATTQDWGNDSALYTGNAGVWAPMSGDPQLGLIYLSVSPPTNDYFGGARPGRNSYANSLVCLDVATGKLRWFFQITHHDLWDWDLPAAPILVDIPQGQNGQVIRAVAEVTKQAFLYVFDRTNGNPLWPIEERPAPQSTVPGEVSWPTQPVPTKPAPFDLQRITAADLIDFTPALHDKAAEVLRNYELGPLYAPPTVAAPSSTARSVIKLPSNLGGANWQGGAVDPESAVVYVGSMTVPEVDELEPAPKGSDAGYVLADNSPPNVDGLPLLKPPWGRITAIDLKSGEHLWMRPNGEAPASVKTHPALKGIKLPPTGKQTRAGLLVTKTLLFAGEGWSGDPVLRVHDKNTGEVLAEIPLPGTQIGLPMSYVWHGRQFIALTVGNGEDPAELVALALP